MHGSFSGEEDLLLRRESCVSVRDISVFWVSMFMVTMCTVGMERGNDRFY